MNRRQASAAILAATVFPELPRAIAGARQTGYALGERIPLRAEYGGLYFDVRTRRLHVWHSGIAREGRFPPQGFDYNLLYKYGQRRGWRYVTGLVPLTGEWNNRLLRVEPWGCEYTFDSPKGGLVVSLRGFGLTHCYWRGDAKRRFIARPHPEEGWSVLHNHAWCDNPAPEEMS